MAATELQASHLSLYFASSVHVIWVYPSVPNISLSSNGRFMMCWSLTEAELATSEARISLEVSPSAPQFSSHPFELAMLGL